MAQSEQQTKNELYSPSFNWRSKKVVIPAAIGVAVGGTAVVLKLLNGDIDETRTGEGIRNPITVVQDIRDNPIPKPEIELPKAGYSTSGVERNPVEAYPGVSEKELDSFIERFSLPDRDRDIYKRVLNEIPGIVKKGIYVKHEIIDVRDGPNAKGLAQDKMVIVYSWHKKKDGREYKIRWLFKPPSENQSDIFYRRW